MWPASYHVREQHDLDSQAARTLTPATVELIKITFR
jgi:hypothetical protein